MSTFYYTQDDCIRALKERDAYRAALTAIVIHGQHPCYGNNWAVYVLDLANNALRQNKLEMTIKDDNDSKP